MTQIDTLYEKVNNETTKSYELKHEKLTKEENELKEKLQNEVTKVKEKLEISLNKVNELIKACEKIKKGMKNIQKEETKMIKKLTYVSKINKNKKEMSSLFSELMRNIKISFVEKENNIKYEEYFFNGIPVPKNVEFQEIGSNSFRIIWKIDDINIINIDRKEIKYRVEMRKENSNEKYVQIYEGNDNNCVADNLTKNTNYEIRICSFYKDITSNWTETQKIKIKELDTVILKNLEKKMNFQEKYMNGVDIKVWN